ncbi:MAG: DUF2232 domain-containing protein [Rhodospirillales bacterium]|nr:DUF2232 domain-containing protein [Rhodospirillales bacterium]MBO6786236.1 DUF2232 domain-containing protein [Rhodospirillales bacterium]
MPFTPIMALSAGICSAVAVFSIVFGSILAFPLFYFAPLPLYLAGLGIGTKGVVTAGLTAVVTAGLIGSTFTALPFAFAYAVPAIMLCQLALRTLPDNDGNPVWYPVGNLIGTLTIVGATALAFFAMMAIMDEGADPLQDIVAGLIGTALERMGADMPADSRASIAGSLAPYFPGMAVASWVMMHLINAAAGQTALVKSERNIRPKIAYADITLPEWTSWFLVGAGVIALVVPGDWSYLGRNLVIVALVPFFLLGLAVVHSFARRVANGTLMLVAFYVLLMVLGWTTFLVAGAGILEQWIGLRKRMQPVNDQESE